MSVDIHSGSVAAPSGDAEHLPRGGGAETPIPNAARPKLDWNRPTVRIMDIERTLGAHPQQPAVSEVIFYSSVS